MEAVFHSEPKESSDYRPEADRDSVSVFPGDTLAPVNPVMRTLIIAIGGQGIHAANLIKEKALKIYSDCGSKIAFLAVDTDEYSLEHASALADEEKYLLETDRTADMRYNNPFGRSAFTASWINPGYYAEHSIPGSGCTRQQAMAKLFFVRENGEHNDIKVIHAIQKASEKITGDFDLLHMQLTVHIIAGIGGGTGGGLIVHMAHLVRRAVTLRHNISGHILLPDTMDNLSRFSALCANGYATLKELDYYYSLTQRSAPEFFETSDPAMGKMRFDCRNPLYNRLFLYGNKGSANPYFYAVETAANAIIFPLIGALDTDLPLNSFLDNSSPIRSAALSEINRERGAEENFTACGEDMYNYFAAGAAAAYIPVKELTDYAAVKLREAMFHSPAVGFGSSSATLSASEAESEAEKLVSLSPGAVLYSAAKLMLALYELNDRGYRLNGQELADFCDFVLTLHNSPSDAKVTDAFSYFADTLVSLKTAAVEMEELRALSPGEVFRKTVNVIYRALRYREISPLPRRKDIPGCEEALHAALCVEAHIRAVIEAIKMYLSKAYGSYRGALKIFLNTYSPNDYKRLYRAGSHEQPDGERNDCLSALLEKYESGTFAYLSSDETDAALKYAENERSRIFPRVKRFLSSVDCYIDACRSLEAAKAAEILIHLLFGKSDPKAGVFSDKKSGKPGLYQCGYLAPIRADSDKVCAFAYELNLLSYVRAPGMRFDTYESFLYAAESKTSVNLNLLHSEEEFLRAKQAVDEHVAGTNFADLKKRIIKSFMDSPEKWVKCEGAAGDYAPERALDSVIAPYIDFRDMFTVTDFLRHKLAESENPEAAAEKLIGDLRLRAEPLYAAIKNVAKPCGVERTFLVVSESLFSGEKGKRIRSCIELACRKQDIVLLSTKRKDTLLCYSLRCALPLYALENLQSWEICYENSDRRCMHMNECGTGDYNSETGLAWEDYPEPALPYDAHAIGIPLRENLFLHNELYPMFSECVYRGLIERKQDNAGKYYYICHTLASEWAASFSLEEYDKKDENGLYLAGAPLFTYLAEKNGASLESVTEDIALNYQGGFSSPMTDERAARDRAVRALRRNVPLYRAVKKTLSAYRELYHSLNAANRRITAKKIAQTVPYYLATCLLRPDAKGQWSVKCYPVNGAGIQICNLNPLCLDRTDPFVKEHFLYEILCRAFMEKMTDYNNAFSFYKEKWDELIEEPRLGLLKYMNIFKEEADDFTERLNASPAALQEALGLGDEEFADMQDHYRRFITLYKKIEQACLESRK